MLRILAFSTDGKLSQSADPGLLPGLVNEGSSIFWVDLEEPDASEIALLRDVFAFHEAAIEDIEQGSNVPRVCLYEDYVYLLHHRIFYHFATETCEWRRFAVFASERYIVTIHGKHLARAFAAVRQRVQQSPKAMLGQHTSSILVNLLEMTVKDYQPVIGEWQDHLNAIEDRVLLGESNQQIITETLQFKKLVTIMRKALWPQRDVLEELYERAAPPYVALDAKPYLKGVVDHMHTLLHELESLRAHAASVFEVYAAMLSLKMTESSNHLNTVMQRLSAVSAIFLPLTFIVGVYGMNFNDMPELNINGFYYALWGFMASLAVGLVVTFKKLKWF